MVEEVGIVGGGAVGLTAAYDLARAGVHVTLYDRGDLGGGSTDRAAGLVYDAFTEDADVAIADRAVERFRAFSGEGEFRLDETPYVWFATDATQVDAIRDGVERMRHHDRDVEVASAGDLRREFPTLRVDDVAVAAVARTAGTADPSAYAALLAAKARDAGADLRPGTPASVALDPPRVNGDRYDAVLVAAGAHTARVLDEAGVPVPLDVYRTQALLTPGPAIPLLYDATAEWYCCPHPGGIVAGDGVDRGVDPDDWEAAADRGFVDRTRRRLRERLVNFDADVARSWAGLCTSTPDRHPLLGEIDDGCYVAAGWEGHGFMRAPATGERVAAQIRGEADRIGPFDPRRFRE